MVILPAVLTACYIHMSEDYRLIVQVKGMTFGFDRHGSDDLFLQVFNIVRMITHYLAQVSGMFLPSRSFFQLHIQIVSGLRFELVVPLVASLTVSALSTSATAGLHKEKEEQETASKPHRPLYWIL